MMKEKQRAIDYMLKALQAALPIIIKHAYASEAHHLISVAIGNYNRVIEIEKLKEKEEDAVY